MADGRFNIVAIIQARLGSKRLPNKALMPLPAQSNGTILGSIIDTLRDFEPINEIYVATSKAQINDLVAKNCLFKNVECYRGSEEDVLSRFYEILKDTNIDYVLRFTADNPIIQVDYLKLFINNHLSKSLEYSRSEGLPLGCNFEMFRASSVIKAHQSTKQDYDREHVTPYISQNTNNKEIYKFEFEKEIDSLRFTIDYPSDYAFMNLVYNMLGTKKTPHIMELVSLVEKNSWLKEINSKNRQK